MKNEKNVLELVSQTMQNRGYELRTQKVYMKWINEYILFHDKKDPLQMGITEIEKFKSYLDANVLFAVELKKQAFQAITFLYTQVFGVSLQKQYIQEARALSSGHKLRQSVMVF